MVFLGIRQIHWVHGAMSFCKKWRDANNVLAILGRRIVLEAADYVQLG